MNPEEQIKKILEIVAPYANKKTGPERDGDDWNPGDGGNFDDTYYAGEEDGRIDMAQTILHIINPPTPAQS